MEWLQGNGFWVLILVLFVVLHFFGHGGHGGHGGHRRRDERDPSERGRGDETRRPAGHQH